MEAAVRHAALRDPTAPASPWTMQKPWMCAAPVEQQADTPKAFLRCSHHPSTATAHVGRSSHAGN